MLSALPALTLFIISFLALFPFGLRSSVFPGFHLHDESLIMLLCGMYLFHLPLNINISHLPFILVHLGWVFSFSSVVLPATSLLMAVLYFCLTFLPGVLSPHLQLSNCQCALIYHRLLKLKMTNAKLTVI